MAATRAKTRYAKSGDVSIAYQVIGDGPLDLVMVPGFVSNVEFYGEMPTWKHMIDRLTSFSRLILFDKRGTGMSDPVPGVPTLEQRMDDVRAVMDAAGSDQAALWGISEGGPMSLLFAATFPQRTSALVLYGTSPKFSAAPDWPWGWRRDMAAFNQQIEESWGEGDLTLWSPTYANDEAVREVWGRYQRAGASPGMARAVLESAARIDCRDILPTISVPTLVLHRSDELILSVKGARYMAEHIPGARLVELPGPDHLPFVGDVDAIISEIEEFLTGSRPAPKVDRVLATVMFTDIVDSTKQAAELGDRSWRDLIERHDRLVGDQVTRHQGRMVKTMGDGVLATFDGPARAIEAARSVSEAVKPLGIEVRAGLHTGEIELIGEDVSGIAVNIGARVGAQAGAGEVLVSRTVTDLVAGSGIEFEPRGAHELKGVPGEWELYAVR